MQLSFPCIGRTAPWLAPLAGHTDLALRVLCREQGAAVACSEMVSAKGLVYSQIRRRSRRQSGESDLEPGGAVLDNGSAALLLTLPGRPDAEARQVSSVCPALTAKNFPAAVTADEPLVIQLFGDEPDCLGQAVELLRGWGYDWFDLNLGCSVPKVLKSGAGAALARDTEKTLRVAETMIRAAGALPAGSEQAAPEISQRFPQGRVGFKLRLGWNAGEENYLDLAKGLEQCGAGWLTLHPRYARQGFGGSADWSALARLRRAVRLPLMASGDLFDAASAWRCLEESGVDGVMFARGALYNPAIFSEYLAGCINSASFASSGNSALPQNLDGAGRLSPVGLKRLILRHAELVRALPEKHPHSRRGRGGASSRPRPEGSLLKMRGAIPRYVRELPGSRAFRVEMSRCESWEDFFVLLEKFFQPFEY